VTEEEWDRQYDEAMRWRDWQTCEQLAAMRANVVEEVTPMSTLRKAGHAVGRALVSREARGPELALLRIIAAALGLTELIHALDALEALGI
jgi:hypothetical protein